MKRNTPLLVLFLLSLLVFVSPRSGAQVITTVAGVGIGDDSLAANCEIVGPVAVAMDKAGNTYIAESEGYRIRKINTSGVVSTFAGTGVYGNSGDGGPATAAQIGPIYGIAADSAGNIYIVDDGYDVIRKIDLSGIITRVAGTGTGGYSGDGGPATAATLNVPIDIVVDKHNNLIFTDWQNAVVRKIDAATGTITTIVGDGFTGTAGNHGPATAAELGYPFRLALDNKGNLYVAEVSFQCICKVDTSGILTIIADTTGTYALGADGDGGSALVATMTSPCGLAVDTAGHLYFSDIGNARIRMIDMNTGIISNYAANGTAGWSGDGGPATAAEISVPEGLACDSMGNVLIADAENNRVRKVSAGIMSTFAGQNGFFGDGLPATDAEVCGPSNIFTDASGNIYFSDYNNARVHKIDASTGIISTIAGNGISGYSGDGGLATNAQLSRPMGLAKDGAGNLYITDAGNDLIRKVDASGIMTTYAGNGIYGFSGDGGPATAAKLNNPIGIAADNSGNLYIADDGNNRVRKVNSRGIISTFAGTSTAGYSGDGGPAAVAKLKNPYAVATDNSGNVYVTDNGNARIRKIDASGIISTIVGTGTPGYSGDGGPAVIAQVSNPGNIFVDVSGNLYVADFGNDVCRYVDISGNIHTIAGNHTPGFSGDGGPATAAMLNGPNDLTVDPSGNLLVTDFKNNRVRKVTLPFLATPLVQNAPTTIHVYPNPTRDYITVENASNSKLVVADVAGRDVLQAIVNKPKQTISMTGLTPGVYFVSVVSGEGKKSTFKIVKE